MGDNRPIHVTVTDPETGTVLGERTIQNDYMILCAGNRYLDHVEATVGGTHVATIKVAAPSGPGTAEPEAGGDRG